MPEEHKNSIDLKKQLDKLKESVESKQSTEQLFGIKQFDMLVQKIQDTDESDVDWADIRDRVLKLIALHDGNPKTDSADDFKVSTKEQVLRLLQQLRGIIYGVANPIIDQKTFTPEQQELQKVLKGFELISKMFKPNEPYFIIYDLGGGNYQVSADPRLNNFNLGKQLNETAPVPVQFVQGGYVNSIARFLTIPGNLEKYQNELTPFKQFIKKREVINQETRQVFGGLEIINSSPELQKLAERISENSIVIKSNDPWPGKENYLHAVGSGVDGNGINQDIPKGKVVISNKHVQIDKDKLDYKFTSGQSMVINKPVILNFKNEGEFYDFKIAIDPTYANQVGIPNIIQKLIDSGLFPKTQQQADDLGQSSSNGVLFTGYEQSLHDTPAKANQTPFRIYPHSPIGSEANNIYKPGGDYESGNYKALYPTRPESTNALAKTGRLPEVTYGGNSGSALISFSTDRKGKPYPVFGLLNGGGGYNFKEKPLGGELQNQGENYKLLTPGSTVIKEDIDEDGIKDQIKESVVTNFGDPKLAGMARSLAPLNMIPRAMNFHIVHIPENALQNFEIEQQKGQEKQNVQNTSSIKNTPNTPKRSIDRPADTQSQSPELQIERQIQDNYLKGLISLPIIPKPLSKKEQEFADEVAVDIDGMEDQAREKLNSKNFITSLFERLHNFKYLYPSNKHNPLDTENKTILNKDFQGYVNNAIIKLISSPSLDIVNTIRSSIVFKMLDPRVNAAQLQDINQFLSAHPPEVKAQFRQEIINQGYKRGISEEKIQQMIDQIQPDSPEDPLKIIKLNYQPILRK